MKLTYLKIAALLGLLALMATGIYLYDESRQVEVVPPRIPDVPKSKVAMGNFFLVYREKWVAFQDMHVSPGLRLRVTSDVPLLVRVGDVEKRSPERRPGTYMVEITGVNGTHAVLARIAPDASHRVNEVTVSIVDPKLVQDAPAP